VDERTVLAITAIGNYESLQVRLVMLRMAETTINAKVPRVY